MRTSPDITVVIPVFNRGSIIRYTLESVRHASSRFHVETLVIDDGSTIPTTQELSGLGFALDEAANPTGFDAKNGIQTMSREGFSLKIVRQENRGLLLARLKGLELATGRNILFLDSDDLIGPAKFAIQLEQMERANADVSYSDVGTCRLEGEPESVHVEVGPPTESTSDPADFFIRIQPPPHSPIFRSEYLRTIVRAASFPASALYNSVAEIWFYYNAASHPARVEYVPGAHTIVGIHPGERLTNHWERLGVASLAVLEAFSRSAPTNTKQAERAKLLAGEAAFRAWRALPRGVPDFYSERLLRVAKKLGSRSTSGLGGPLFRCAARVVGPVAAARAFKSIQRSSYQAVRTLSDTDLHAMVDRLPPA